MSDRAIDPTSGDFINGPAGSFAVGDELANKVALSVLVDLGSWEGAPLLGSRLYLLQRMVDTNETLRRAEGWARDALKWLVDSGEIVDVVATFERHARGVYAFEVDYTPPGQKPRTAGPFYVAVGTKS